MTGQKPGAPIGKKATWQALDWEETRREARRLQVRIAKVVKEGKSGKAKALQWILTHSFRAKMPVVKRVTSKDQGKGQPLSSRIRILFLEAKESKGCAPA